MERLKDLVHQAQVRTAVWGAGPDRSKGMLFLGVCFHWFSWVSFLGFVFQEVVSITG